MPLEISKYLDQLPNPSVKPKPIDSKELTSLAEIFGITALREMIKRVFTNPDESERRNNSAKAKSGELTVNRPKEERIPNLHRLTTLAIFQPDTEPDEHQGGTYGYNRTLNYYLTNLITSTSPPSSFAIFVKDANGQLIQKTVTHKNGRTFCDKKEIYPNFHQDRWRFPASFLKDCIAYKIIDPTATQMGIAPCWNNTTLRRDIKTVTEENPDITMLQYRGHNGYGAGANIPEDLLDPAIVFLGGCKSDRFLKKAQKSHFRSGLVTIKHKTGWEINHHRARAIMQALKDLKRTHKGPITWEALSTHLRTKTVNNQGRFGENTTGLPGDDME